MRKSFSFVFMGVLGFTAAVGASSFSSSTILNFQNAGIGEVVNGVGSDGFTFSGNGASFVETGDGNIAVSVTTTIGPDDFDANTPNAVALQSPSFDANPFFAIESEPFEFVSAKLDNVFDLTEQGFIVAAFGQTAAFKFFKPVLPTNLKLGKLYSSDIDLAGTPLTSLGFSVGPGPTPTASANTFTDESPALTELLIDEIEVITPTPVPIPASALLLATALLGAGAFARRKAQS